jgi:hypothetical protein
MYATAGHVPQREVYQPMRLADNFADVTILGDPQFTMPLAAFIQATGRFTQPGERNITQNANSTQ